MAAAKIKEDGKLGIREDSTDSGAGSTPCTRLLHEHCKPVCDRQDSCSLSDLLTNNMHPGTCCPAFPWH